MNKEEINPTTLELLKLNQLQESYIVFLESQIVTTSVVHGISPTPGAIKTAEQLKQLIEDLKRLSDYEEMKKIIVP